MAIPGESGGSRSRKQRKRAVEELTQLSSDSNGEDEENEDETEKYEQLPPTRSRKKIAATNRESTGVEEVVWDAKTRRKWLAFCCKKCGCSKERKKKYFDFPVNEKYMQSSVDHYYHRRCCHDVKEVNFESATPLDYTIDYKLTELKKKVLLGTPSSHKPPPPPKELIYSSKKVHEIYKKEKTSIESRFSNATAKEDPINTLETSQGYVAARSIFNSVEKLHRPAVVLDLFGGVGTSILALKRNRISVSKVVSCEHDKVATHVYRENHDPTYSESNLVKISNSGIDHVYFESFEELETTEGFEQLMSHAPYDLVIATPPCSDYSKVNAHRRGVKGNKGSYMIRVGQLMKKIKNHEKQQSTHLHFVVENVPIEDNKDVPMAQSDLSQIERALGVSWKVELDAAYFSPTTRHRHFFTNIAMESHDFGDNPIHKKLPAHCLNLTADGYDSDDDKEFKVAAEHFEKPRIDENGEKDRPMWFRLKTFMASKAGLDDERMLVFCKRGNGKKYVARHLTAHERAAAMGYPDDYFSPVKSLFQKLTGILSQNRHLGGFLGANETHHWKNKLESKLDCFKGAYHSIRDGYQIDINHELELFLRMHPPNGDIKVWFTYEEYQKRLIGNAVSVPVMEHILGRLQEKFPRKTYSSFVYQYCWGWSKWQPPVSENVSNDGDENGNEIGSSLNLNSGGQKAVTCDGDDLGLDPRGQSSDTISNIAGRGHGSTNQDISPRFVVDRDESIQRSRILESEDEDTGAPMLSEGPDTTDVSVGVSHDIDVEVSKKDVRLLKFKVNGPYATDVQGLLRRCIPSAVVVDIHHTTNPLVSHAVVEVPLNRMSSLPPTEFREGGTVISYSYHEREISPVYSFTVRAPPRVCIRELLMKAFPGKIGTDIGKNIVVETVEHLAEQRTSLAKVRVPFGFKLPQESPIYVGGYSLFYRADQCEVGTTGSEATLSKDRGDNPTSEAELPKSLAIPNASQGDETASTITKNGVKPDQNRSTFFEHKVFVPPDQKPTRAGSNTIRDAEKPDPSISSSFPCDHKVFVPTEQKIALKRPNSQIPSTRLPIPNAEPTRSQSGAGIPRNDPSVQVAAAAPRFPRSGQKPAKQEFHEEDV
mmetsp:Transcript_39283/g.81511  ORF Transcript_39283/g.81511 Transcript_39283/m.81511 type:complete len:1105 (+) Transcript_39283:61-3375(+)